MDINIVWMTYPIDSPLARALGSAEQLLLLPHFVETDGPSTASGGLDVLLNARTLSLGILTTTDEQPPYADGTMASGTLLRTALRQAAQELSIESEDALCADMAAYLRVHHGNAWALNALRRAVMLVPDGIFCRGDLVVVLFLEAQREALSAGVLLQEAAAVFQEWENANTAQCKNAEAVFYCGMAAFTYIGHSAQRDAWVASRRDLASRSSWLRQSLSRLQTAKAWSLEAIVMPQLTARNDVPPQS